jgi:DNA-binding MarR family transcriptional regulator
MNKDRREKLTSQVTEILKRRGLLDDTPESEYTVHEIVGELGKILYESLNRKVPFDVYMAIWKKYNSEGGWTVSELAKHYGLSITTVTAIIKDKYW